MLQVTEPSDVEAGVEAGEAVEVCLEVRSTPLAGCRQKGGEGFGYAMVARGRALEGAVQPEVRVKKAGNSSVPSVPARWRSSWSRYCAARAWTKRRSKSVYWYMRSGVRPVNGRY